MTLDSLLLVAAFLLSGIEAAYVPSADGGGEYLVRVEPDLVRNASPYQFTSDVPADARDVRRVKIIVADSWPPPTDRLVREAATRPRERVPVQPAGLTTMATVDGGTKPATKPSALLPWLLASLMALFLSLGANAYLGMLLGSMRQRYLDGIRQGFVKV
ncbi:MAG: hypothetical protein ACK5SI_13230 [Planctomycetia bacterium]|jgi:hypothetical protein